MDDYVIGVDAGGTKTEAWAVDRRGRRLARAEAGPGNVLTAGVEAVAARVAEVVEKASLPGAAPAAAAIGMAGAGRERERAAAAAALRARGLPENGWDLDPARWFVEAGGLADRGPFALFDHDALMALAAATAARPGVVLIAGTGSIAFAVDDAGARHRAGGWGHLFDDLGSGFWIGRETLAAVFQAYDGRGPRTRLEALARERLAAADTPALTSLTHGADNPKAVIASLAPACAEAAAQGDPAAADILDRAARELARMAAAVVHRGRFSPGPVRLGMQGGALEHLPALRERAAAACAAALGVEFELCPARAPAWGAALLAAKALGWDVDAMAAGG